MFSPWNHGKLRNGWLADIDTWLSSRVFRSAWCCSCQGFDGNHFPRKGSRNNLQGLALYLYIIKTDLYKYSGWVWKTMISSTDLPRNQSTSTSTMEAIHKSYDLRGISIPLCHAVKVWFTCSGSRMTRAVPCHQPELKRDRPHIWQ